MLILFYLSFVFFAIRCPWPTFDWACLSPIYRPICCLISTLLQAHNKGPMRGPKSAQHSSKQACHLWPKPHGQGPTSEPASRPCLPFFVRGAWPLPTLSREVLHQFHFSFSQTRIVRLSCTHLDCTPAIAPTVHGTQLVFSLPNSMIFADQFAFNDSSSSCNRTPFFSSHVPC